MWAPQLYIGVFGQTSTNHSGSPRRPFFKPSSATGSACSHLHHGYPCALFHPGPPGRSFFTSWPGTHAHCHIYLIQVCICSSWQILFTLGIWLFHVQVLDQHLYTLLLQVYTQHWHVVSPTVLHSHSSHTLCYFAFKIPIPGLTVLTPPFALFKGTVTR
jgi:hypothetical protein